MDKSVRVCLILEGTYPYVPGGVSAWTHELIRQLPHVEFVLLTLSSKADQEHAYKLPSNVVEVHDRHLMPTPPSPDQWGRRTGMIRLRAVQTMVGDTAHPHVVELLRDLESAASLNPLAPPGSRHGARAAMRRLWTEITDRYRRENPFYPLGEFFWTWFNARALLLSLLEAPIPEADVYHALCTGYAGFAGAVARAVHRRPLILTEHGFIIANGQSRLTPAAPCGGINGTSGRNCFSPSVALRIPHQTGLSLCSSTIVAWNWPSVHRKNVVSLSPTGSIWSGTGG